jgi:2-dehydropantoate 2-reductase
MGCLFGGLLTEAGVDVQLLDLWPEHVRALNEQGLSITRDGEARVIRVQAFTDPAEIRETDLALIFVKHAQTREAAETAMRLLGDRGYLLTLQNGMGNAEIITEVAGPGRVVCGTTAQGAMRLGPGRIQHSGVGKTIIGMWEQERLPIVDELAALFAGAKISTAVEDDIRPVIWSKLFVNVGINAVTALTNTRNGQLLDLDDTRDLVKAAVTEAMQVAASLHVKVAEDALQKVFSIARATASNRSSMGQDVDRNRPTEIDAINGYIVRRAGELGLEVPVNQTLTSLIKTMQQHY